MHTHGFLGDAIEIGAHKMATTKNVLELRKFLGVLSDAAKTQPPDVKASIVISGKNPMLTRTEIEAVLSTPQNFPGVWLVYAGNKRNSDILQPLVEARGIKYGFIDICTPSGSSLCWMN